LNLEFVSDFDIRISNLFTSPYGGATAGTGTQATKPNRGTIFLVNRNIERIVKRMIYWLLGLALICCLFLVLLSFVSRNPPQTGIVDGRLRPCPETPNCVCSEDEGRSSFVKPFAFEDSHEMAWERLKGVISQIGGVIQKEKDGYLWATFTSKIFRFVDDVEFRMNVQNGIIHVRSASRVGYSDMGMNRKRVEQLRARFSSESSGG
jgi:uncharacterized protein (DUF1499 family)